MGLALRLIGIIGVVLLVVLVTSLVQGRQVAQVFARAEKSAHEAHQATEVALQAQVHFKKQVQEWKNVLLRGANERDLAKYTKQFHTEARTVRRLSGRLITLLPDGSPAKRTAEAFVRAHRELDEKYERGLRLFEKDPQNPFRVDAHVRGIDRVPTDLLSQVVERVASWRDQSLRFGANELTTAQETAILTQIFVFLVATIFMLMALRAWVHRPIRALTGAAERLAAGELGTSVQMRASGEFKVLGRTFNQMSAQVATLVDEVRAKAEMEQELAIAETVQAALLPEPKVHRTGGIDVFGRYRPATRCGGDWWSYFNITEHQVLVMVGDVTGHGLPTTLITASVNACCQELQRTTCELHALARGDEFDLRDYVDRRGTLGYLLEHLNQSIVRVGHGRFLMTFSAALIDTERDTITYANAGNEAPLLIRHSDEEPIVPLFSGPSLRLGERSEPSFEQTTLTFAPGDTVVWYTDGLVDVANRAAKTYGGGRLLRQLRNARGEAIDAIAQRLFDDIDGFSGQVEADDDMTLVVARRPMNKATAAPLMHRAVAAGG